MLVNYVCMKRIILPGSKIEEIHSNRKRGEEKSTYDIMLPLNQYSLTDMMSCNEENLKMSVFGLLHMIHQIH